MAAIKAQQAVIEEKDSHFQALIEEKDTLIAALRTHLERIEALVAKLATAQDWGAR